MAQQKQARVTRDKLLDHGLTVFMERGYNGSGLREILDEIAVPKGSFYHYFRSKEQFGALVIRRFSDIVATRLDAKFCDSRRDAFLSLKSFFRDEIQRHQEEGRRGCLIGNLGAELGDTSELCRKALDDGFQGMVKRFEKVLLRAQEDGKIRDDIPSEDLANFLLCGWEGALLRMKIKGSVGPLKRFSKLFFEDFLAAGRPHSSSNRKREQ